MHTASFIYQGKKYAGWVVCSDQMEPHYYWFINKDQELIDQLGEDVAFVLKQDELRPLNYTLAERHPELFSSIISAIRDVISGNFVKA